MKLEAKRYVEPFVLDWDGVVDLFRRLFTRKTLGWRET